MDLLPLGTDLLEYLPRKGIACIYHIKFRSKNKREREQNSLKILKSMKLLYQLKFEFGIILYVDGCFCAYKVPPKIFLDVGNYKIAGNKRKGKISKRVF